MYDGFNQLATFNRGTTNSNKHSFNGSSARSQTWSADPLGAWSTVTTDDTAQGRTHNAKNQLTAMGTSTLTCDANGNFTTAETGQ